MQEKVAIAWSGGKDCTLALYETMKRGLEVACLLTTITKEYDRVTMHGIRRELIEIQAEYLGFPLEKVYIPAKASNEQYEKAMEEALLKLHLKGIKKHVFGDIFLEDVRKYREKNLSKLGLEGIWPLWGKDTKALAKQFIDLGFKAVICCVDSSCLSKDFIGKDFDEELLSNLPANVDPCGERGEFHTFVYDGPIFKRRVKFKLGEVVLRDGRFYFIDLITI